MVDDRAAGWSDHPLQEAAEEDGGLEEDHGSEGGGRVQNGRKEGG